MEIDPISKSAWNLLEQFNGAFTQPWISPKGAFESATVVFVGPPTVQFATQGVDQVAQFATLLDPSTRAGFVTEPIVSGSLGRIEARVNAMTQDVAQSGSIIELWLLDEADPASYVRLALTHDAQTLERALVLESSVDGVTTAPFQFVDDTWYRLRIDADSSACRASVWSDDGSTELAETTFSHAMALLGDSFRIGLSQAPDATIVKPVVINAAVDQVTALPAANEPGAFVGKFGGNWFDPANWLSGAVPGADAAVLASVQVQINQPGAVANSINILPGGDIVVSGQGSSLQAQSVTIKNEGALTIGDGGAVIASSILVKSGGTLRLTSATALLNASMIQMEGGSIVDWSGGTVTLDAAQWSAAAPSLITIGDGLQHASLQLLNGSTLALDGLALSPMAELTGNGFVQVSSITNGGTIRPGNPIGAIAITGQFTQTGSGRIAIEAAGILPATQLDQLTIDGAAVLGGWLELAFADGFIPGPDDVLAPLSATELAGIFDFLEAPLADGDFMLATYSESAMSLQRALVPLAPGYAVQLRAYVGGGRTMDVDSDGNLIVGRGGLEEDQAMRGIRVPADGGSPALVGEAMADPGAVACDHAGVLTGEINAILAAGAVSAEPPNGAVHRILADESTAIIFGPSPEFPDPADLLVNAQGALLIADGPTGDVLIALDAESPPTFLIELPAPALGIEVDQVGRYFTLASDGIVRIYASDGSLVDDQFLTLTGPQGAIAIPTAGSIWGNALHWLDAGSVLRTTLDGSSLTLGTQFTDGWLAFGMDNELLFMVRGDASPIFSLVPLDGFPDLDADAVPDDFDNCPSVFNPLQGDDDVDGVGNACDCPADIAPVGSPNGEVGAADLAQLLSTWGPCPTSCIADIAPPGAGDGIVGPGDLAQLLASWGSCE